MDPGWTGASQDNFYAFPYVTGKQSNKYYSGGGGGGGESLISPKIENTQFNSDKYPLGVSYFQNMIENCMFVCVLIF